MVSSAKIAPCPFSKGYRIDADHAWQSLTVFFLYRLTMGGVLVFLYLLGALPSSLGSFSPALYSGSTTLYLVAILASALPLLMRRPAFGLQAQLQVFVDIALIPLIMHASGGVESGVGVLLGLSVAAGGLLVGGRCALLFAALASLAVLGEEVYADLGALFPKTHYTYAGMLGASYFGSALLALVLAQRAERSEAIAEQRGTDLQNFRHLSEFVIRHLQSGILVVDQHGRVRMYNEAAARLFAALSDQPALESVSPYLAQYFREWLADPTRHAATVRSDRGVPIQAQFTRLGLTRPPMHLIFLEDSVLHHERVQQSKLASLGRLAASIAHEIRNPLSAIRHASQLLAESPRLGSEEQRLIQIVLEQTGRLNRVVENVLQISRRGEARREAVALVPALEEILQDFQRRQGGTAVFRLEARGTAPTVLVDPSHLKQIVENLCSNALKYGNPQLGPITLRIVRIHGAPCLEILDHAPPIEAGIAQNLFEPFFTTSPTGTGLGLYLARELAELNRAKLTYDCRDGRSCFRLYLPAGESGVPAP
ncbi:ATP-binding protein [Candidatus Methylocalor cossyra]|uniref:histidine kinase n=1 Tax=Candidatus Methylocalor cossyra TaxID=3108543 RepID=A0ABM9NE25_9GAMM